MPRVFSLVPILLVGLLLPRYCSAQTGPTKADKADEPLFSSGTYSALKLRSIGPAVCSGRIVGVAVHPQHKATWYVAVASGGVWKTTNAGTTWTPLFDDQGSYSIGTVTLDPRNPQIVWVGTGENNSQRSVGYGDGVYKSLDGGKSWQKLGLDRSEHIGKILLDPRDGNVAYVAAQGPLWNAGGDRGLYKTTDGGKTWTRILNISDNTGITDVVCDPRNPDILLAAAYQRRRHVWTLINGGPEGALYRSTDAGKTWNKLSSGLPTGDIGRIGLAVAPSQPNIVYAIIEAQDDKGGIFRSDDGGLTWQRRNPFNAAAMYYSHLVVDPKNADRLFVMNVFIQTSDDGGKTLRRLGMKWMHVDCHCMWIDPEDTDHYLVGCDGGLYESHDRAANWRHIANLPVTQFYDITCDEAAPFYHVYGGTQDNNTLGGPARNRSANGIANSDWFVIHGGDGFHCKVDPRDPNTVYGEAQYGDLIRFDRKSGQAVGIRPYLSRKEAPLRWNWDSPLVLSPHSRTRLYYGANRLFRSDDRGDSWQVISPDLSRQIDRNLLPVMGKIWGPDAIAKSASTSLYGNLVALSESPRQEDLLYAGSDDGLIHVTADAGKSWSRIERFPGVPEKTYVSRLFASQHDADTVYAAFSNHKNGDFKPYLLRSRDRGKTWTSIAGNLPVNGPVWAFAEDHVDADLLFVGTEFGLYFTVDGGKNWVRLKNGLPTIAVRDLAIQKQMNDLVVGTFGRGIYILDDYASLRKLTAKTLAAQATLFPVRETVQFIPMRPLGLKGKGFLGEAYYIADNPPYGAVFTYHLAEGLKTLKERRLEREKKEGVKTYPSADELRAEDEEEAPAVVLEIADASNRIVRRLTGPVSKGTHRVAWDLREVAPRLPVARTAGGEDEDLFSTPDIGPLVLPGTYRVRLLLRERGTVRAVAAAEQTFRVVGDGSVSETDRKALYAFQSRLLKLRRAVGGTLDAVRAAQKRLGELRQALDQAPGAGIKEQTKVRNLEARLRRIQRELSGDNTLRRRNENSPLSLADRVAAIVEEQAYTLAGPTATHRQLFAEASAELTDLLGQLRELIDRDMKALEKQLDPTGAPWIPGRLPDWPGK